VQWFCLAAAFLPATAALAQAAATSPATRPTTARAPVRPAKVTVTPTLLYRIPDGVKVADVLTSPDARHLAVLENRDGKYWVAVDGVRSPAHEWVVARSLNFAPDGSRFCYQVQHDAQMFYVIGQAAPAWQATEQPGFYMLGQLIFSADGKRFLYVAQKQSDGPKSLIVDGAEQARADEIFPADMQFSSDGKRYACRVRTGQRQRYIIDGALQPEFDSVGGFMFSANGQRFGYFARTGDSTAMMIDGKEGKRFPAVLGLVFSMDGRKYAYVVQSTLAEGKKPGKQQLVYNSGTGEQAFAPFDRIGAVAFSPDGRRLALSGLNGEQWSVAADGKFAGTYEGVGMLMFSPDSRHLAVVAGRGGQQFISIDGRELPPVDVIGPANFSPDSSHIAYVAREKNLHWLYEDDKKIGPATFFAFSPDSVFLAHAAPADAADTWQLALDGEGYGPIFQGFPTGSRVIWESPTTCRVIAGRDKEMFRVRVELIR
jgi:hypothetical protein